MLRRLAQRKEPLTAIAGTLGRTVEAVRTKAAHESLSLQDDLPSRGPRRQPFPSKTDGGR
ncbi:hypothetical protein [Luteitalea pratensis]|uniref:hypothetical protein n=1 Tax=Luteitalea pratensis TaxID=1855912 RepID=UPI0012FFB771|nr:hypothetical protein [Luteitalea pratensis]